MSNFSTINDQDNYSNEESLLLNNIIYKDTKKEKKLTQKHAQQKSSRRKVRHEEKNEFQELYKLLGMLIKVGFYFTCAIGAALFAMKVLPTIIAQLIKLIKMLFF